MTLMAIFVSVFTLVNVNLVGGLGRVSSDVLITMNLSSVGSLLALFAVLSTILDKKSKHWIVLTILSAVAFIAAVFVFKLAI